MQKQKCEAGEIVLSAAFISMTTGCKGPTGIIVLAGYGVFAIILLTKKKWREGIGFGLIWLIAFLITYLLFIQGDITSGDAGLQILGIPKAFWATPWTREMYNSLSQRWGFGGILLKSLLEVLFVLLQNIPVICLFLLCVYFLIICLLKKQADIYLGLISLVGAVGILLTICTYQAGGSQVYFLHAIFPIAILGGFYGLDKNYTALRTWQKYIFIVMGIVVSFHGAKIAIGRNIVPMSERGITCIKDENTEIIGYPYIDLTSEDLEAYSWIRDNTNEDDILAVDTFYITESGRLQNMIAGVFTERFVWNDGKYSNNVKELGRRQAIVERAVSGDEAAINEMQKNGVRFFLQTLGEYPDMEYPLQCVFQNESFKIYILE